MKELAGIYTFVKGDGSCPYYAVLACLRELEHASTEAEQTPTVGDLRRVQQMREHNVEWLLRSALRSSRCLGVRLDRAPCPIAGVVLGHKEKEAKGKEKEAKDTAGKPRNEEDSAAASPATA